MTDIEERKQDISPSDYVPKPWVTLKRAVGDLYDNLGLVLIASFAWFAVAAIPTGLGLSLLSNLPIPYLGFIIFVWHTLVVAPVLAGIFHLAGNIAKRESPAILDIIEGARRFLIPSWQLAALQLIVTAILVTDVVFFLSLFVSTRQTLYAPLMAVALYALLFWGMMVLYQWPLLVEQRPPTFKLIYRSFLLVADNLSFTTIVYFAIILLTILCISPGMAILYMGAAAVISTNALRDLLKKYGLVEVEPEVIEDKGWRLGKKN
ncbi:MAG: hypothetical protein Q7N50_14140 [Armatimonadota bacterium]|nr:hypothetical protein [Armatimonadota bacterium]